MTATGHAVIGTVIAATMPNPLFAAPVAVLSHLAADYFPHWDSGTHEKTKTRKRIMYEAVVDVSIGFIVSYLILTFIFPNTSLFYAFIMIILAQGFDWAWAPEYFFKMKNPISDIALYLGRIFNNRLDKPWGIINQVAILVALIAIARLYFY